MENPDLAWVVTGASGFLGTSLVKQLLEAGRTVIGVDLQAPGEDNLTFRGRSIPFVVGNGANESTLQDLLEVAPDQIIIAHLAASNLHKTSAESLAGVFGESQQVGQLISSEARTFATQVAVLGSRIRGAVVASSMDVYGHRLRVSAPPLTEASPTAPDSAYGLGKQICEAQWRAWGEACGVPVAVLRLGHMFGPFEDRSYDRVIPRWLRSARDGEPIRITGDLGRRRSYLFAPDAADVMRICGENRLAGTWNLAADPVVTLADLASACVAAADSSSPIIIEDGTSRELYQTTISSARLQSMLGKLSRTPLEEGLRQEACWLGSTPWVQKPSLRADEKSSHGPQPADASPPRRILVTGASGYLGLRVLGKLLEAPGGHEVVAVVRRPESREKLLRMIDGASSRRMEIIRGDLLEADTFSKFGDSGRYSAIVHCAATTETAGATQGVHWDMTTYWLSLNGNALPLSMLLQWRNSTDAQLPTLIAASSQSVYGLGEKVYTETAPLQPSDPYGLSKAIGEWAVSAVSGRAEDIIIRLPSLFGPDDPLPHATRLMLERSLAARNIQLTSLASGQVRKQLMFVEDAANVLLTLALSPDQVMKMTSTEDMRTAPLLLNTASLELLSIREIADCIAEAVWSIGISVKVETLDDQEGKVPSGSIMDVTRAQQLGLGGPTSFATALSAIIGMAHSDI